MSWPPPCTTVTSVRRLWKSCINGRPFTISRQRTRASGFEDIFARKPKAAVHLLRELKETDKGPSHSRVQYFFFFFHVAHSLSRGLFSDNHHRRVTPLAGLQLNAKTLNSKAAQFSLCRRLLPPERCFLKAAESWHQPPFLPLIQAALTMHTGYFLLWLKLRALLSEGNRKRGDFNAKSRSISSASNPKSKATSLSSSLNKWSHQNTPAKPPTHTLPLWSVWCFYTVDSVLKFLIIKELCFCRFLWIRSC